MSRIRILIAEDHAIVREGLTMLLEGERDMEVVGAVADGVEVVEEARRLDPDVVLLDLSMPRCNGIDALPRLRRAAPRARILVLSMHGEPSFVRPVLEAGGHGYIEKNAHPSRLIEAIHQVFSGKTCVHVRGAAEPAPLVPTPPAADSSMLSQRERQVLERVALGFTSREIGEALGLSKKTVDSYRSRIAQKLDLRSRAQLVRAAAEMGLLSLEGRGGPQVEGG